MIPQQGDQLNGVIIFDAQTNPLEALSTKEKVKALPPYQSENLKQLTHQKMNLHDKHAHLVLQMQHQRQP